MMVTTLNLKNAILTNHVIKYAIKRNQMVKNYHKSINFASTVEKKTTLSHDVLNNKLINIVESILNLDNKMVLNLNLLHRRCLQNFSKNILFYGSPPN